MKIYGGKSYILKETQETSLATTIYEPYMDSSLKNKLLKIQSHQGTLAIDLSDVIKELLLTSLSLKWYF